MSTKIDIDVQNSYRLKLQQDLALEETKTKLGKLKEFRDNYIDVNTRLHSLPNKIKHTIMVPLSPVGFMPGYLIHTNEILAFLGDNWFLETSAKNASEIVDRRIHGIDDEIQKYQKQEDLLKPWINYNELIGKEVDKNSDYFEIREDYNEEEFQEWKRSRSKTQRQERNRISLDLQKSNIKSDDDYLNLLDELERLESNNDELERCEPLEHVNNTVTPIEKSHFNPSLNLSKIHDDDSKRKLINDRHKKENETSSNWVKWVEIEKAVASSEESSLDSDDYECPAEWNPPRKPQCIKINHTPSNLMKDVMNENSTSRIDKPSHIFLKFNQPKKSILKTKKTWSPDPLGDPDVPEEWRSTSRSSNSAAKCKAFTGTVIERESTTSSEIITNPRKTSRFRASISKSK